MWTGLAPPRNKLGRRCEAGQELGLPMSRLVRVMIALGLFALVALRSEGTQAQAPQPSPTATAATSPVQPSPTGNIGFAAATASATATPTATVTVTDIIGLLPTPTPTSATVTAQAQDSPVEGTVITNRSGLNAKFFLEGATYTVAPNTAHGVRLPRATSVLNLYTCDAAVAETNAACFWDPYLVQQDGLYDIFDAVTQAGQTKLLLREAGAPPTDQVWVQNRTGRTEAVVFRSEVIDLPATTLHEFPVSVGAPAILYVRHCLSLNGQSVCEWTPKSLEAGTFYALVESTSPAATPGGSIVTVDLQPVVGAGQVETPSVGATPAAAQRQPATNANQILCRLLVPVLNVRSGPGLQYLIIDKVRSEGASPATVLVTGQSTDGQWLTVDPAVTEGGWITSSANFIACEGTLALLPRVEAPPLPEPVVVVPPAAAPNPVVITAPAPAAPVPPVQTEPGANQDSQAEAELPVAQTTPVAPPGQGLLVVNNGFQHEIRVTIDQRFRPVEGPSEFDLQPGGAVTVAVFPGSIAFTASSPWSGLSRNASLEVAPDSAVTLWLRFERDSSGSWYLLWD